MHHHHPLRLVYYSSPPRSPLHKVSLLRFASHPPLATLFIEHSHENKLKHPAKLSSTRGILAPSPTSPTTTMNTANDAPTKHALPETNGRARPSGEALVHVQPPRREDLQPSYAQQLHGDDSAAHGWYGGMSMETDKLATI